MNNENIQLETQMEKAAGLLLQFLKDYEALGVVLSNATILYLMRQLTDKLNYPRHNERIPLIPRENRDVQKEKYKTSEHQSAARQLFHRLSEMGKQF